MVASCPLRCSLLAACLLSCDHCSLLTNARVERFAGDLPVDSLGRSHARGRLGVDAAAPPPANDGLSVGLSVRLAIRERRRRGGRRISVFGVVWVELDMGANNGERARCRLRGAGRAPGTSPPRTLTLRARVARQRRRGRGQHRRDRGRGPEGHLGVAAGACGRWGAAVVWTRGDGGGHQVGRDEGLGREWTGQSLAMARSLDIYLLDRGGRRECEWRPR